MGHSRPSTCLPACLPGPLTIVVALDSAHQAEELDDPAEAALHLLHEHTGQELVKGTGARAQRRLQGRGPRRESVGKLRGACRTGLGPPLTESMFLEMMTVTL